MTTAILTLLLASATPFTGADGGDLTLRINLPERRLEVVEDGETIRSYPAAIGAPSFPTPTGRYRVSTITWNPWWHPPDSRWARGEEKTPPGPANPMGRAKLRFDRLLYVHGTSNESSLGTAASHGCIRISNENVLDLARLLSERSGALPAQDVAALEASPRRTQEVALPGDGIEIIIEYRLVKETDEGVERFEDVYDLGLRPHEEWLLENEKEPSGGLGLALPEGANGPPSAP